MNAAGTPWDALAASIRGSAWLFPVAETIHILGFVILVGSVVMFDLRVLGLSRTMSVRALAGHLLPWTLGSVAIVVPTGVLLFLAQPELLTNRVFIAKLGLLALAAANAAAFHAGPYAHIGQWDRDVTAPASARLIAAASILIWVAVITAGRFIAYV